MEITKIKHNFLASLFLQPSIDPILHFSPWQTPEAFSTQGDSTSPLPALLQAHPMDCPSQLSPPTARNILTKVTSEFLLLGLTHLTSDL